MKQLRRNWEFDRTVTFLDDEGETAMVDGDPTWTSSDDTIISLVAGANPFAVTIQAVGAVGASAFVTVAADADLGSGVEPVQATDEIVIVSGQATSATFSDSEPRQIGGASALSRQIGG